MEFQTDVSIFLAKCKSAGKTRLIIDIRGNPGGTIYLGYDLFKQLFPTLIPYSGIRIRGSDAANALGNIASSSQVQNNASSVLATSIFNDKTCLVGPDGPSFNSWQQVYGPLTQNGDLFSNIFSWSFSNATLDMTMAPGVVVSGYANKSEIPPQVFTSDSITLVSQQLHQPVGLTERNFANSNQQLTDGQCSSTCATFTNLMINQGRVKTATAGGRPNKQPMAVIGGVQGAEVLPVGDLQTLANEAIGSQINTTGNSSAQISQVQRLLGLLASDPPILPYVSDEVPSINFLDNIAQGDKSSMPLQFTAGISANCRFYYMPGDIVNLTYTWARVAKGIKAGGSGLCINGTLSNLTQTNSTTAKIATANTTIAGGSNGSAPLAFVGSASVVGATQLGWIIFTVAFGAAVTALI